MRDKFICSYFEIDLSELQLSYREENPMFKESFFTQYSMPFEFLLDRDLTVRMGAYNQLNAVGLKKRFEGYHIFEGHRREAVLEILSVQGDKVEAQIDSGFESLPNFDKKLKSLPFPIVLVDDIYVHAEELCKKKYPEVNYNFPAVIFKEHSSEETGWEVFNQFINDRINNIGFIDNNEDGSDWDEKSESERTPADKLHKNRNIIQPMPYVLDVLKVGFADAGYELQGDILSEDLIYNKVVFAPNCNYTKAPATLNIKHKFTYSDYTKKEETSRLGGLVYALYKVEKSIGVGKYSFQFTGEVMSYPYYESYVDVEVNGKVVLHKDYNKDGSFSEFFEFFNTDENGVVTFRFWTWYKKNVVITEEVCNFIISPVVTELLNNRNQFSISEFVPDITFGEFVKILVNWMNYDMQIEGGIVFMNKLKIANNKKIEDISIFEVEEPKKTFSKKRSFNIKSPEIDGKTENAYIDSSGVKLGAKAMDDTTEIELKGYCLPIEKHRGRLTSAKKISDDAILGLIHYDGLNSNSENWGKDNRDLMLPEILSRLYPWYKQRIENNEYQWDFIVLKNKWRHINMNSLLYAYGRKMRIKEITKNSLNRKYYKVDLVLESVK